MTTHPDWDYRRTALQPRDPYRLSGWTRSHDVLSPYRIHPQTRLAAPITVQQCWHCQPTFFFLAHSMPRATFQALRTARRVPVWKAAGKRPCFLSFSSNQIQSLRSYSGGRRSSFASVAPNHPMYRRKLSLAVFSTVVASGAWFAYQGDGRVQSLATQVRGFASSAITSAHAENPSETASRALLVGNDQFYTATLSGDQPLSKTTDDSDRRVLNMLTPEQATEKLRKNEESYLVNRGKGVVRYDIAQVPSNSPIEDDHAELIVEMTTNVAPTQSGESNRDWAFWTVFDGHS